jgi:hypothetical protein
MIFRWGGPDFNSTKKFFGRHFFDIQVKCK